MNHDGVKSIEGKLEIEPRMASDSTDTVEEIAAIIVTYNNVNFISKCIDSLESANANEIIVVDNASTDGTVDLIRRNYPDINLVQLDDNIGYGSANNIGVREARSDFIVILNPDTIVEEDALSELVNPIREDNDTITTPKILTYEADAINTCGNIEHFTGLTFTRGFGDDPENYPTKTTVNGVSGACFAINRDRYDMLGGFDDNIFLYMEDAEFSWRANVERMQIEYVPTARIRHDYERIAVDPRKLFHLEKGRYYILRKYLTIKGILMILPSLMVTELLTWGYSARIGLPGLYQKLSATYSGLTTRPERVGVQQTYLISSLDEEIPTGQLSSHKLDDWITNLANKIFLLNILIVKYIHAVTSTPDEGEV